MDVGADFLVVGSGIAGLRAALSLADAGRVVILTKADPRESNTGYAQGGIAVAFGPDDSPELHARDTIAAGDGLCVESAVDVLVREGPRYVHELLEWGAGFDRVATGGAGQVFSETTNPAVATGDGMAMAFAAGARLADLEFVQFHPTALNVE